jgi:uncharacterized membrane protein YedE/YeeE
MDPQFRTPLKRIAIGILELACFAVALAFLIPPGLSDIEHQIYHPGRAAIIGGSFFALSLGLARHRKAESLVTAAIKLLSYLVVLWLLYERVTHS